MIECAFRVAVFPCKPEQALARNNVHTNNIAQISNDATAAFALLFFVFPQLGVKIKTVRTLAALGR
jgi:hypothetical protein